MTALSEPEILEIRRAAQRILELIPELIPEGVPMADPASFMTSPIAPGRQFAADSFVHTPLPANAPIHPSSAAWVARIVDVVTRPGTYGWSVNTDGGTPNIYVASATQPTVRVRLAEEVLTAPPDWQRVAMQPFFNAVPLPDDFVPIAGGDSPTGGDAESVIYQPSSGKYWEGIRWVKTGARILDSAGRTVDEWAIRYSGYVGPDVDPGAGGSITTHPGYWPNGRYDGLALGIMATGIPHLATIMSIAEQRAGVINHALQFMFGENAPEWVWPAWRTDGTYPGSIPEGVCFRLPASLNLDAMDMDPYARMIAKAVQKYGMYLCDTAPNGAYFRGESAYPRTRWVNDPYVGPFGILNPTAADHSVNTPMSDWPTLYGRLRGFPFASLQAVDVTHITHRPGYGEL